MVQARSRVIIVDDHAIFRAGVVQTLRLMTDVEVVGEGASLNDAVMLAERHRPGAAFIDLYMPGGGVETVRRINQLLPDTRIIVLTVSEEDDDIVRAFEAGASAYMLKGISATDLVAAVSSVLSGESYVAPQLGMRLVSAIRSRGAQANERRLLESLTQKEAATLQMVGDGLTNREIAARSGVQIKTVKFHVSNLLKKLGVRNRVELAIYSRKHPVG